VVIGHSAAEQAKVVGRELSSCFRETKNARLVIEACLHEHQHTLRGAELVYTGDNQGSIHCLNHMVGQADIFEEVRRVCTYLLAAKYDVHLEFVWQPRTQVDMQRADALSRT
jgi:hypothetical protein